MDKKAGVGTAIFVIFLIILAIVSFIVIQNGALERAIDPCEKALTDCNHNCGSGILSSICKEKCTYDYNNCKS